jgi:hypothetical protein
MRHGIHLQHLHLAIPAFDIQGHGHLLARLDLSLQANEHDMQATGPQLDGAAGGQIDRRHLAHAHDVAIHLHGVQFHGLGHGGAGGDQPVGGGAGDLQEAATGGLPGDGRPGPGVFHARGDLGDRGRRRAGCSVDGARQAARAGMVGIPGHRPRRCDLARRAARDRSRLRFEHSAGDRGVRRQVDQGCVGSPGIDQRRKRVIR